MLSTWHALAPRRLPSLATFSVAQALPRPLHYYSDASSVRHFSFEARSKAHRAPQWIIERPLASVRESYKSSRSRSYQTSSSLLKLTKKQMNIIKKDPRFQAMMKEQQIKMERIKAGEAINTGGTRMNLISTSRIADPCLPLTEIPSASTKEFWLLPFVKLKNFVFTYFLHPVRVINIRRKAKLSPIKKSEVREKIFELYSRLNQDRAAGNVDNLRDYASEALQKTVRQEVGKRAKVADAVELQWVCKNPRLSLYSYRTIAVPDPFNCTFLQVVYRITSDQAVNVVNKKTGELIKEHEPQRVVDFVGMERNVDKEDSAYILVDILNK